MLLKEQLLPTTLNSVRIAGLSSLKSLEGKGLRHLTSLQKLSIYGCPSLEFLPAEGLQHLTSLQQVSISRCPNLQFLPEDSLPPSLSFLEIYSCSTLEKRYANRTGEHWAKISDIPCIQINEEKPTFDIGGTNLPLQFPPPLACCLIFWRAVVWNCKVELPKGTVASLHQLLGLSGMSEKPWHAFLVFFRCHSDLHVGTRDVSCRVLIVELKRQMSEAIDVSSHQFPKHIWHDNAPLKEDDGTPGWFEYGGLLSHLLSMPLSSSSWSIYVFLYECELISCFVLTCGLVVAAFISCFGDLLDSIIVDVAYECHQIAKLRLDHNFEEEEEELRLSAQTRVRVVDPSNSGEANSKHLIEIFGQNHPYVASKVFECMICGRSNVAGRFALHLEKCMGKGRKACLKVTRSSTAAETWNSRGNPASTYSTYSCSNSTSWLSNGASGVAGEESSNCALEVP
ncbi:hypothetical protein ACFX2C_005992 [Malus domestica]